MAIEWLKRMFGSPGRSTLQQQVDADVRIERDRRRILNPVDTMFSERAYGSDTGADPERGEQVDASFGTLIAGLGAMKGVGQFAESLLQGGLWFGQLNQVAVALDPPARLDAVRTALLRLSIDSRQMLGARLTHHHVDESDSASLISNMLGEPNGFERLISVLAPSQPGQTIVVSGWSAPAAMATTAGVNVLDAMRDPLIRDLARTLVPALIRAGERSDSSAGDFSLERSDHEASD